MSKRKLSPVQQACERCAAGRRALLDVARPMELTQDPCGIVWERFVFPHGESAVLVATPSWWDVYVPLCRDGEIAAVVAAIKQRAADGAPVVVPALDHDAMMLEKFATKLSDRCVLERRIVANLIAHLQRAGFYVHSVNDGEELRAASDAKSAMEMVFAVDESSLRFYRGGGARGEGAEALEGDDWHGVLLVLGNGIDCISDWNFAAGDPDGFDAAMNAFDAERFA